MTMSVCEDLVPIAAMAPGPSASDDSVWDRNAALQGEVARLEEALRAVLGNEVDALFLEDAARGGDCGFVRPRDLHDKACQDIAAYSMEDMQGRMSAILQGPGTDQDTRLALRSAMDQALPFHGEILNYRRDGLQHRQGDSGVHGHLRLHGERGPRAQSAPAGLRPS